MCGGHFWFVVVAGFIICQASAQSTVTTNRIVIGNTAAVTGAIASQGIAAREGLEAALSESNRTDVLRGIFFSLYSYDDGYETSNVSRNIDQLVNVNNMWAMVGTMGTVITNAAIARLDQLNLKNMPVIGSWTGSDEFRVPFRRNLIHIRPGYFDECAAMVNWVTSGENYYSRISAMYQADGFGLSGIRGIQRALSVIGLSLYSNGSYIRNTLDVEAALESILSRTVVGNLETAPEVVCVFALSQEATKFIWSYRRDPRSRNDTVFLVLSIVGAEAFYDLLDSHPLWKTPIENIYMTQVVPPPLDTSFPIVQSYQRALRYINPNANFTYNGLEGYINGRFLIEAVARIRGNLTSDNLVSSIYEGKYFTIDGLILGPYSDDPINNCSQGLHQVFFSQLLPNGTYLNIPSGYFTWSQAQCVSSLANIAKPLFFGQSAALTGPSAQLGIPYRRGLLTAIERFNRLGGRDGQPVRLLSLDDGYEPAKSVENTKTLLQYKPVALIGWSGTAVAQAAINLSIPAQVPFFCPFTGAIDGLRKPCSKYVIHTRVSYFDEAAAQIAWLWDHLNLRRISVFFQRDGFGQSGFDGAQQALRFRGSDVYSWGTHERNSVNVSEGVSTIAAATPNLPPQAIILFAIYAPAANFIETAARLPFFQGTVLMSPSVVNTDEFLAELSQKRLSPTLWVTQVFPNPFDTQFDIVREYQEEITLSNDLSRSYIAGRIATRALQLVSSEVTPETVTNAVFDYPLFDFGGLLIGPFTLNSTGGSLRDPNRLRNTSSCLCNQGGHEVYLTKIVPSAIDPSQLTVETEDSFSFSFDTCGSQFKFIVVDTISPWTKQVMQAISGVASVLCVACGVGVLYFRETRTMKHSSPAFLLLLLFGALLLALSPLFPAEYYSNDKPANPRTDPGLCMAWIWFVGVGFQFMFATIVVKTYRVERIFNSMKFIEKVIVIRERDLVMFLSIPVLLELMLLTFWTSLSFPSYVRVPIPGDADERRAVDVCVGSRDLGFVIAQGVLFAAVAAIGCYYAWRTRNIRYGSLNESREILFVVYNLVVVAIVLVSLSAGFIYSPLISSLIRSAGIVFLALITVATMFGAKFYRIFTKNEGSSQSNEPNAPSRWNNTQLSLGPIGSYTSTTSTLSKSDSSRAESKTPSTGRRLSSEDDTEESSWEPPPSPKKFWHKTSSEQATEESSSNSSRRTKTAESSTSAQNSSSGT